MTTRLDVREILFPTDFSDVSRRAGALAADLARQVQARLHVLHVVLPVTDPAPAAARLEAAAATLGPGLTIVPRLTSGLAAREIAAYAEQAGIGLIVMGTHGRTGFSHALLGSVAGGVVRRVGCPVLTVPARGAEPLPAGAAAASCVVCAKLSPDLICEGCRALIRGEALERKLDEERRGRGSAIPLPR